jgi:glutamine synthetase
LFLLLERNKLSFAWGFDDKIYFDRSMDAGKKTWLDNDMLVLAQPGGWVGIPWYRSERTGYQ